MPCPRRRSRGPKRRGGADGLRLVHRLLEALNGLLWNNLHGSGRVLEVLFVYQLDKRVCLRLIEMFLGSLEVHFSCKVKILGGLDRGQDHHVCEQYGLHHVEQEEASEASPAA